MNAQLRRRLINMYWYCIRLCIFIHMIIHKSLNKTNLVFNYIKIRHTEPNK